MSELSIKDEKRIIDALKKGNIPNSNISELCVGREKELTLFDEIFERVNDDEAITKFIKGNFGAGKSFFLKALEEKAFQENFVVSWVTLSNDVRMNKIDVVYKAITKNLKCKTGTGLKNIVERWYTKLQSRVNMSDIDIARQNQIIGENILNDLEDCRQYSNAFASAIESYIKALRTENYEIANNAMAWLTGDFNIPFTMKRQFGVKGDVEKENALLFLKALSTFLKSLDYSGLVILFDETEYTMKLGSKPLRDNAYNYIRDIYDGCSSGEFDSTLFVFAGTPEFFEDEKKGIRSYHALSNRIKANFSEELEDIRKPIIQLKGLNHPQLELLGKKIIKMHEDVYDWNSSGLINLDTVIKNEEEKAQLKGILVVPRSFLKLLVDYLDIVEQDPSNAEQALKEITQIQAEENIAENW